ncbi:MAG: cobalamin-dependent protein, partial [Alphaproteobacteria bacterium]|nr:cobalamin-dependent protein [Alphaproteobacteria bacterium]
MHKTWRNAQGMFDICLIRPPAVESFRFATTSITLPLGLAYIAAAVERDGRRVCVVDAVGEGPEIRTRYCKGYLVGLRFEEVVRRIPHESEIVGITVVFTHEWPSVVRLVELIKQARPDLRIILGGEHITSMPEFCLMTSEADYLVIGEGEECVVDLLEALDAGDPLDGIEGIAFR